MTGAPFRGLSAFTLTPADPDGAVIDDDLARLVERAAHPATAFVAVLGSTGIYAYLDRAARRRAVEIAAATLGGQRPLIAGIGALRTDAAMAHARDAAAVGADGLLLAPVSYTPLTEDEVAAHVRAVARATDLPLCLYNNPSTTRFTFSPTLLERLAAEPNVTAVKMPLPSGVTIAEELKTLRARLPEGFVVGYSADWGLEAAFAGGADAFFSVVAGLFPEQTCALADAAGSVTPPGDLGPLLAEMRTHGSLRVAYAVARHLSLTEADLPRPLLPVPDTARLAIEQAVAALSASG